MSAVERRRPFSAVVLPLTRPFLSYVVDGDLRWDARDDDLDALFVVGLNVGGWRAWSLRHALLVNDDRCMIIRLVALKRTDCLLHCCRGYRDLVLGDRCDVDSLAWTPADFH